MSVCFIPPYTPLLYSKTGVWRGRHYFLSFALKHILWVLVRIEAVLTCTNNICFEQNMKIVKKLTEKCHFYSREKSLYITWVCFRNVYSKMRNRQTRLSSNTRRTFFTAYLRVYSGWSDAEGRV